jgi:hypothetical protein
MATKTLRYDHPAYITPYVMNGATAVGANGSAKFAAFAAMQVLACHTVPVIASTAAGSQPLMYKISGTTTTTSTLTILTSAAKTAVSDVLATRVDLAKGDAIWVTHGTDATASLAVAVECQLVGGASLTA